jgi:hypothetical protein
MTLLYLFGIFPPFRWRPGGILLVESVRGITSTIFLASLSAFILLFMGHFIFLSLMKDIGIKTFANWDEYRLTDINKHQFLWGISAPWFLGIIMVTGIHFAIYIPSSIIFCSDKFDTFEPRDLFGWFYLVFMGSVAPVITIFICFILNLVTRIHNYSRAVSLCVIIFLGFLTSPFIFHNLFMFLNPFGFDWESIGIEFNLEWDKAVALCEILTWPVKIFILVWIWRKAARKLEGV